MDRLTKFYTLAYLKALKVMLPYIMFKQSYVSLRDKTFSGLGICLMASSLFISFAIKPTEARCSQIREFTILDSNNHGESCSKCPTCPPGKGLAVQCGSKVKNGTFIGCENCENDTYSDTNDTSHCKPCNQCGSKIMHGKCTPRQNSNCSMTSCIPGYYMDHVLDQCLPLPVKIHTTLVSVLKNQSLTEHTGIPVSHKESLEPSGTSGKNLTNSTTTTNLRSKPTRSSFVHPSKENEVGLIIPITGGCLLCVVFLIYLVLHIGNKMKQFPFYWRTHFCLDSEGAEGGEEIPLTEYETHDHLVDKLPDETDGRTTLCLVDYDNKNAVTAFSSDCLLRDQLNVHVMDELAGQLDQPVYPRANYWVHLAAEFQVPKDVIMKCQHSFERSPSKHLLEIKEGVDTSFSVQELKKGLKAISRNDLVQKVDNCHLAGTAPLRDLRERHPTIFENICLQMDHHNNWKALGLKISIPDETLQQIATSTSCAMTVLEIIEKKNPRLTVKEMRDVLKEMLREDVCKVLDKYLLDSHTIVTLRESINCLEEAAILLDKETPGMKTWMHFARKFGVSKDDCDSLKPNGKPSPTRALLEYIVQVDPDLKVKTFIEALVKMQRMDVVNALGKFICASTAKQASDRAEH